MAETTSGQPVRRSVDVVIPAYNEQECIPELTRRLGELFDRESAYDWRAIVVENGSADGTWEALLEAHAADPRITAVQLSRNFHMDGGLTAGLDFVTADAAVFMTADLQDPPEAISEFLRAWEDGADNVYGLVTERKGTGPIRRFNSQAFYWLANRMTNVQLPRNASDFRLMDRRVYEAVRDLDESNRFMRGLVAWTGFHSVPVPVARPPRFAGDSKAYSLPVLGFAVRGILAHSFVPIRLISAFGFVFAALSAVAFVVFAVVWLTRGVPFAGFGSLVSLALIVASAITIMLGVIAEYIGLIYQEVKGRPNFIVRGTLGLEGDGWHHRY
jgi:dolichol-phosphate mannosyltransferase